MFNAKKTTNEIIEFIRDYYKKNNLDGAVLGISGGKDSAVVAGLCTLALGRENVIGVTLPCHSKNKDKTDAEIISNHFGFKLYNLDLTNTFDTFTREFENGFGSHSEEDIKDAYINLKPRLRMASVYFIAQAMSDIKNKRYLVMGTSNKCELYVGYFTKGGDSVHDISPIGDLTVEEVIKVGDHINTPKDILYKKPSDGLSNQSDEEKLGVKYAEITNVIKGKKVEKETKEKIRKLHKNAQHKFITPMYKKEK